MTLSSAFLSLSVVSFFCMLVSVSSHNTCLFHLNWRTCNPGGPRIMGKFITYSCISFTFQKCINMACNKYCRPLFLGLWQIFYFLIIDALLRDTLAECYASDTCCLAWILKTCEVVSLSVPAVSFCQIFFHILFIFFLLKTNLQVHCKWTKLNTYSGTLQKLFVSNCIILLSVECPFPCFYGISFTLHELTSNNDFACLFDSPCLALSWN